MARKKLSFTSRYVLAFGLLMLLTNTLLGVIILYQSNTTVRSLINKNMLDVVKSAAGLLDGDTLAALTEKDVGGETYRDIEDRLIVFQNHEDIHESGYRLWLDDFGSGYSSLNVFGQYHIDRIKFDMELVRHLDDSSGANRIIMESITEMCRRMGIHTLAEGIETEEQYQFLRGIGCEMVQGFLFFRPEPLEKIISVIRKASETKE